MRIVHYLNQFYAGLGGEDAAGIGPRVLDGTVGPGRLLAQLLADEHQIVATIVCGDDYAASNTAVTAELLGMARSAGAELLVAGPAFGSGRYGLVCARLAAANADPNRLLPLDTARELERSGVIGRLHDEFLVTVGNGTSVATARRFGVEWAAELRKAGVQAAILTAT